MYLRCGAGFGLGGPGKGPGGPGKGPGDASGQTRRLTEPRRCAIRVAAGGTTVDGKPMLRDEVVAACKAAAGADVLITGDARQGDGEDLLSALRTAGIPVAVREPPGGSAGSN